MGVSRVRWSGSRVITRASLEFAPCRLRKEENECICNYGILQARNGSSNIMLVSDMTSIFYVFYVRYQSVTTAFYRNAFGFMVVFDLTNQQSFVNCRHWITVLSQHCELDNPDMILVGNKSDIYTKREVTTSQAQDLAKQFNMDYIETSAKDGTNVQQMMDKLISRVTVTMEKEIKRAKRKKSSTPTEKSGFKCCSSS